ncbi:MAG: hypothetical protein L6R40_004757 [Gallowayella cf. fulva]|nr:MAG: hypothetical protein L6R40_004757 [Xanthomendoza cf. fulva]
MRISQSSWQERARAKVADLKSRIPHEWVLRDVDLEKAKKQRTLTGAFFDQFFEHPDLDIFNNNSVQLVWMIRHRRYTAVEVAKAYCKGAAVAQQINNCLHEIMFDDAMQTARELDQYYEESGHVKGPLHGLPISLKDQFHVKGYDTTMGYVGWIGTHEGSSDPAKVHKVNSQVVEELLSLGAVLYCKVITSLPQTLSAKQRFKLSVEAQSDSALILNPGQDTHASSVGVMGTSVGALKLIMASMLSTEPWTRDPNVVKMPWNDDIEGWTLAKANPSWSADKSWALKFGMFWTDGVVTPHPPVRRALRLVHDVLKQTGQKVRDSIFHARAEHPACVVIGIFIAHLATQRIHGAFLAADGSHDVHRQLDLSGEPLVPQLRNVFQLRDPLPLLEYQDLTLEGKAYNEAYSDYWNSTDNEDGRMVDAFVMPVAPHAAVISGKYYHNAYTESINLLDYSAVVIPVTTADKSLDKFDHDYEPLNEKDRKNWEAYDPETYDGAPVGLQIVARKWEEEKVWAIAKIVDDYLKRLAPGGTMIT